MVFGKEIKGGSLRDKRRSFGREKGLLGLKNPREARKKENQRENSKEREKGGNPSLESLDFLK